MVLELQLVDLHSVCPRLRVELRSLVAKLSPDTLSSAAELAGTLPIITRHTTGASYVKACRRVEETALTVIAKNVILPERSGDRHAADDTLDQNVEAQLAPASETVGVSDDRQSPKLAPSRVIGASPDCGALTVSQNDSTGASKVNKRDCVPVKESTRTAAYTLPTPV
jgi:hypothetical protein